jgi:TPP-dependent pyruvate/acetoin dehydrogenase alpha subunit
MTSDSSRKPVALRSLANDDIGEQARLHMFRTQVTIREAEQLAYDLFLRNLVKGTCHLSLGQDAGCILAVGAGERCAMVVNGQLTVATQMCCTLSVDRCLVTARSAPSSSRPSGR